MEDFKSFAAIRIIIGIIVVLAILGAVGPLMTYFNALGPKDNAGKPAGTSPLQVEGHPQSIPADSGLKDAQTRHIGDKPAHSPAEVDTKKTGSSYAESEKHPSQKPGAGHGQETSPEAPRAVQSGSQDYARDHIGDDGRADIGKAPLHHTDQQRPAADGKTVSEGAASHLPVETAARDDKPTAGDHAAHDDRSSRGHGPVGQDTAGRIRGVAFIEATIKPLDHELNERFWGWRPNDILNITDNVNNVQLGVLEVTRRTAMILAERISRTGITAAFDENLEQAMNWFMIKSDRYWFPSAESKYNAGLDEFALYRERLEREAANFYTRADNLIPLLMAYEDLLGSCEENLVKKTEEDGSPVSFFKADDYIFYAKGVAGAMATILEAVGVDFKVILESRRGLNDLHHAVEACHHALEIHPRIILDSEPSSIFANHRANMAAPLSHARFYLGVLIKTLST